MHTDHKTRWVFGPMVPGTKPAGAPDDWVVPPVHAAQEYSLSCDWPCVFGENALAHCIMNAHQLAAARADPRLIVLQSIHAKMAIPAEVSDALAAYGVCPGMDLHDLLVCLSDYHAGFDPED